MDAKDKQIEDLKALVAALTKRIAELELQLAKAKKDSSTSSKPPSSDIVKPKPKKKPGQRKRRKGGQRGHQRQLREPLSPERVDETITWEIDDQEVERLGLMPTGDFDIIQRIELPETPISRYQLSIDRLPRCRRQPLHARCIRVGRAPLWAALVSDDRLAQVGGPLELLDARNLDGRCVASPRVAWLLGEALHRYDRCFIERCLRRTRRRQPSCGARYRTAGRPDLSERD